MKCECCKKEFSPTGRHQKFCSPNCRNKVDNEKVKLRRKLGRQKQEHKCRGCNKPFEKLHGRHMFCNAQCRDVYLQKERELKKSQPSKPLKKAKCDYCKTPFAFRRNPPRGKHRFCSDLCRIEFHKELKRTKNLEALKLNPIAERLCDFCLEPFTPSKYAAEEQRFCSQKCKIDDHAANQREQRRLARAAVTKVCPICNQSFSPNFSMREIYCSPNCRKCIGRKIYKMMASVYEKCGTEKEDHSHEVLGYSAADLLARLQTYSQWETLKLGSWHLDHIFPIIAFVRKGITDATLICSLDNLQPLAGSRNCSKGDAYNQRAFDNWLAKKLKT